MEPKKHEYKLIVEYDYGSFNSSLEKHGEDGWLPAGNHQSCYVQSEAFGLCEMHSILLSREALNADNS